MVTFATSALKNGMELAQRTAAMMHVPSNSTQNYCNRPNAWYYYNAKQGNKSIYKYPSLDYVLIVLNLFSMYQDASICNAVNAKQISAGFV